MRSRATRVAGTVVPMRFFGLLAELFEAWLLGQFRGRDVVHRRSFRYACCPRRKAERRNDTRLVLLCQAGSALPADRWPPAGLPAFYAAAACYGSAGSRVAGRRA